MYPLSTSCTFTLNSTVLVCPAGTVTSIPFVVKSSNVYSLSKSFTFMLPSTKLVPSGILSFTTNVLGAFPSVFSSTITYLISFPAVTVSPLAGSDVFPILTCALFTVSVVSFVGVPSTVAVFFMSFVNVSGSSSSTVTSNVISLLEYGCTFTVIPLLKFPSSSVIGLPSILILSGTSVIPSGILSITTTSSARPPSFFTVIVYVIFSPSTT